MTSNPPSRSARAIIFAPRSCPSSPGFATRILSRLSAITSNPAWVAIYAELDAKDFADLADRDLAAHGLEYRLHQVFVRTTGFGDARQRFAHLGRIALALHLAHALHLPLLDSWFDLEGLDRNFLGYRVLVDPHDGLDPLL